MNAIILVKGKWEPSGIAPAQAERLRWREVSEDGDTRAGSSCLELKAHPTNVLSKNGHGGWNCTRVISEYGEFPLPRKQDGVAKILRIWLWVPLGHEPTSTFSSQRTSGEAPCFPQPRFLHSTIWFAYPLRLFWRLGELTGCKCSVNCIITLCMRELLLFFILADPSPSASQNARISLTKDLLSYHINSKLPDISLGGGVRSPSICFWFHAPVSGSKSLCGEKSKVETQ